MFSGCAALTEAALPDGMTVIGESAFFGCHALTRLELPASLEEIQDQAFEECENLEGTEPARRHHCYRRACVLLLQEDHPCGSAVRHLSSAPRHLLWLRQPERSRSAGGTGAHRLESVLLLHFSDRHSDSGQRAPSRRQCVRGLPQPEGSAHVHPCGTDRRGCLPQLPQHLHCHRAVSLPQRDAGNAPEACRRCGAGDSGGDTGDSRRRVRRGEET